MRVFAVSDLHVDYESNAQWVGRLSASDHQEDLLIVAGDVSDSLPRLGWCLTTLARRFRQVLFVPGNHELWVVRENRGKTSMEKFDEVRDVVDASGASMEPFRAEGLSILPLLGWYDHSFGVVTEELKGIWMDYRACLWPEGYAEAEITAHFTSLNERWVEPQGGTVITFSHFLPRIDLMPAFISPRARLLYPVLGTPRLDHQLRALGSTLHVYGHSHVPCRAEIDGVTYINHAFGYPSETWIDPKGLACIHEC